MTETATIGDNLPYDAAKVADFADAAGAWLDKGALETEEAATKLNDFITGCRGLWTKLDTQRSTEKKPHWDAGQAVDALYRAPLKTLQTAGSRVKPLLTAWATKKADAEAKRKLEAEEAARIEREAAEKEAAAAESRHDVAGEVEAQEKLKAADKAVKEAARAPTTGRVASATGGGRTAALRTYRTATVTSLRQAFLALEVEHGDEFRKMIVLLANQHLRADKEWTCAGIKITEERKIA